MKINSYILPRILRSWEQIYSAYTSIYIQRKEFFDERKKLENKQIKLEKLLAKIEEDSFIFSIPGKFPEAYYKSISELQRRKVYNKATQTLCDLLHQTMKSERKTRHLFNAKYGTFMPQSIQSDLSVKCMDIVYSREQAIQNSDFKFIDKIQIKNTAVSKQLYELLQSIFKTISSQFRDLEQKDSADAAINEKMEKENKELLLQASELKANEEKLRAEHEQELSIIKASSTGKDRNILEQ